MATRVEINSTLASLTTVPDLNEIRNEDKSQRVYVSVLSDASNKTKEASASLSLEEKNKFGSTLRSATMPSLGSRPRLFPKPFSKEKSSDTFANVKPPTPAFRSSSLIRKATEETSSVKVLSGNVPPLVDQKVIENDSKSGSEVVTNMTFYTGPSANTVILFETAGTEQSKVSLAQEKRAADDHRVFSTMQTKELQCSAKLEKPSQPSETFRSPEGSLHRQIALSSSLRPVSWNSLKTGEKKDAYEVHPREKNNDDANNINSKVDFSTDVQQRPKHRPVSAIFLESLRDQTHRTAEASEEKSPTEKSWVRKPRPLSMDLTAKFEHKDLSSYKKTCLSHESKENVSIISLTDVGCHNQSETGPKPEETEFNKGSSSKTNLKCSSQDIGVLNSGKYLWETKLKSKSEQIETKPEITTDLHSSERNHETTSESRTSKGEKRLDEKETCMFLGCESPAASSEKEVNIVRGSVKKHISLFTLENPSTSVDTELLPSTAEKENRCVNIQQRIKELTAENTDVKPGNLRRSLQSRPLSADLTKMFSSPTSSSEAKPEKPAETRNDSINEMQENQKSKEIKLTHGTDFTEAHAAGNPWKPRQILKMTNKPDQVERKESFLGDGQHFSQQSENSVSFTSSLEKKLKPTTLMEKTYMKTVRATMFDHNVQRHNIAADHPGTDSALKTNNEPEAKRDVVTSGHSRRSWMGEVQETTSIKREYHKPSDSSKHMADAEKSGKPACSSEDKKMTLGILLEKSLVEKSEKTTPKNAEDSLIYQRIEPRYEIFQTCGERALSEAITMAPEKKAMTLRTRKSSVKENKNDEDASRTAQSARANNKTLYLKEDNVSEVRDTKVFTSKSAVREPNDFFFRECTSPEQKKDSDRTETDPIVIAEKIPYSTNKSKCLGVNEKVDKLLSEIKNDKSEVSSMDKTERSNMMKCSSEKRSFRPAGTDSYEFRTNFDREVISASVNKHGAQSSSVLSSGQFCKSSSSHHADMKVLTVNKEESRAFGLRKSLDFSCKEQDFSLDSTAHENSEKIRVIDPEEKVRRTRSSVSDLKISERWRRRTLPRDSTKTEEVVTPENSKRLSRTDSLQLDEGSVKKRSKKSKEGMEGNEANQTVLGSPDDYLKSQRSAFEPQATYFAVTYQIPGNKKEKSFVDTAGASQTNTVSSSSEGTTINLDPAFPGRSKPLLQQPNKNLTSANCREDSREVRNNKDWVKEEDKDDIFSKNIAFGNFHVSRKGNQQYHDRGLDHSTEKIIDVDAFLLKQDLENTAQTDLKSSRRKASSYREPRSPLHFAQLHKDSELVPQKRSENNCDLSERKVEGGYRSQILDIDAIMADYKEESMKASNVQDRLSEDHGSFRREKSKNKRNVSDKTTSYSWKEWKGSDHYSVNNKQGDYAEEYHRPEKLILNEKSKEKLESCSLEFDKQKSKDRKFSPPYWGNPSSFFSDKFVNSHNSPVEFTRKKTFIIDEDEEVNLTSRHQSPKFVIDKVQPINAVATDQRWEVNFASKLSLKADDGLLQKKLVIKEQFLEVSPEGDRSRNVARSSVTRNKDNANKTTRENDSSNVKIKTDWKNYMSGLGSAPPDLRRSYSEKSRQGKDNLPLMQEVRGRKDLHRSRQSFPLESVDNGWKHKMSSQLESFFHEDKKASRKEWTKQSSDKTDGTEFPLVSTQRSRHSFYKDRRADNGTDQLKQCFSRQPPGAKDTDTLVQEPDSQYGTWNEQRHSGDSFVPESPSSENDVISTRKQPPNSHPSSLSSQTEPASLVDHHDFSKDQRSTSLDRSSTDMDSTDGTDLPPPGDTYPDEKTTDFSFIDQTTVLDSSALKTRVQLSKKRRRRAPISHSLRRSRGLEFENRFSLTEEPDNTWMFKDSTEEKKTMQQEDSDEEDKTQHTARSSSVQAQRLPVFPGMDHSALKAQLRKRQESESPAEISSAQLFKSPKPQLPLGTPGSRLLPSSVEKEDRSEEKSPQWLKELKSKKRQSHYENQV
uniref:KIAA1671 n=1 Tax=Bubo bubo TaxID=30461 RepID=A0A8C0FJ61_BUBBB